MKKKKKSPIAGTEESEITIPSAQNLELSKVLTIKPGIGQNRVCLLCTLPGKNMQF